MMQVASSKIRLCGRYNRRCLSLHWTVPLIIGPTPLQGGAEHSENHGGKLLWKQAAMRWNSWYGANITDTTRPMVLTLMVFKRHSGMFKLPELSNVRSSAKATCIVKVSNNPATKADWRYTVLLNTCNCALSCC